jgi:hypothetical protein
MSYSDFNLQGIKQAFNLKTFEKVDIFADSPEKDCSPLLTEILAYNVPIATASNSEKARSEMIISPILIDLRRQFKEQINLFSGVDFSVDIESGLNGICDFIISHSPEVLVITAPVIIIIEAKKENIHAGLGQCIAEMVAARIFNQNQGNEIAVIYGAVTSGTNWKFLKLENQIISIDLTEYYLRDIKKIMGILASAITNFTS